MISDDDLNELMAKINKAKKIGWNSPHYDKLSIVEDLILIIKDLKEEIQMLRKDNSNLMNVLKKERRWCLELERSLKRYAESYVDIYPDVRCSPIADNGKIAQETLDRKKEVLGHD